MSFESFNFTNSQLNATFGSLFTCIEDFGITQEIFDKCELIDELYIDKVERLEKKRNKNRCEHELFNALKNNGNKRNFLLKHVTNNGFTSIEDFHDKYARCRLYISFIYSPEKTISEFITFHIDKIKLFTGREVSSNTNNLLQFQLDMHIDELVGCGW